MQWSLSTLGKYASGFLSHPSVRSTSEATHSEWELRGLKIKLSSFIMHLFLIHKLLSYNTRRAGTTCDTVVVFVSIAIQLVDHSVLAGGHPPYYLCPCSTWEGRLVTCPWGTDRLCSRDLFWIVFRVAQHCFRARLKREGEYRLQEMGMCFRNAHSCNSGASEWELSSWVWSRWMNC